MGRTSGNSRASLTWFGYLVGTSVVLAFLACVVVWVVTGRPIPIEIHGLMAIVVGDQSVGRIIKRHRGTK